MSNHLYDVAAGHPCFLYFTLANPAQELEGIPVMFGNIEDAGGYEEPPMNEITPPVEVTPTTTKSLQKFH